MQYRLCIPNWTQPLLHLCSKQPACKRTCGAQPTCSWHLVLRFSLLFVLDLPSTSVLFCFFPITHSVYISRVRGKEARITCLLSSQGSWFSLPVVTLGWSFTKHLDHPSQPLPTCPLWISCHPWLLLQQLPQKLPLLRLALAISYVIPVTLLTTNGRESQLREREQYLWDTGPCAWWWTLPELIAHQWWRQSIFRPATWVGGMIFRFIQKEGLLRERDTGPRSFSVSQLCHPDISTTDLLLCRLTVIRTMTFNMPVRLLGGLAMFTHYVTSVLQ